MADEGQRIGWRLRAAEAAQSWAARRAARARAVGPPNWPEPRVAGHPGRGKRLLQGRLRIGGEVVEAPGAILWDLAPEGPETRELHAMEWLDDLAALGEPRARRLAQDWVGEWAARFGAGTGTGWTPELAAGRLLRLLGHARFLLHPHGEGEAALAHTVAAHAAFLERRWNRTPPGRERLQALLALLQAQLALPGRRAQAPQARDAFAREAAGLVDPNGAVATRSPEDLLEVMAILAGAGAALATAELPSDPGIGAALARAAPTLRALRHADGSLARFHGGCRGAAGQVDQVLAAAGRPSLAARTALLPQMGFLRLAAGRTTVIVDAAPPPSGAASLHGHASTLAFELTSGRRPVVVNCGPGQPFGPRWRRAARATPSHSTLSLEAASSARLAPPRPGEGSSRLSDGPQRVILEAAAPSADGQRVELAHDGWRGLCGLTHARILHLSPDGRTLEGEDMLTTLTWADGAALDRAVEASQGLGLAFEVRFHLHPDAYAEALADGTIGIALRSGEDWLFSHDGEGTLTLEPSIYLERSRLEPRETLQIVLADRAIRPMTRLRWTLGKGYGTPEGLRDLNPGPGWDEEDE